jgi:hypothetical protein
MACNSADTSDDTFPTDGGKADELNAAAIEYAGELFFGGDNLPFAKFTADFQRFGFDFTARAGSEIVLSLTTDAELDVDLTLYKGTFDETSHGTIQADKLTPEDIDPTGSEYFYKLFEDSSYFVVASTPSGTGRGLMELSLSCEGVQECRLVIEYDFCPEFVTDWAFECFEDNVDGIDPNEPGRDPISEAEKEALWKDCTSEEEARDMFEEYCDRPLLSVGDYICDDTVDVFIADVYEPFCADLPAPGLDD